MNMKNGKYILVKPPNDYPGKLYKYNYCYEHHLVFWKHTGTLPIKGECLHHKNGNTHDNQIENLELIQFKNHSSMHNRKRGKTVAVLMCPNCKITFMRMKAQTQLNKNQKATFCSRKCSGEFYRNKKWIHNVNWKKTNIIKIKKVLPL